MELSVILPNSGISLTLMLILEVQPAKLKDINKKE